MCVHCVLPTEGLTWDDLCELWDLGAYTGDEVKKIATLYYEGAELSAVLEVIEKVENDSPTSEAYGIEMNKEAA